MNTLAWIKKGEIRVKHLDREDIESCGAEHLHLGVYKLSDRLTLIHQSDVNNVILKDSKGEWDFRLIIKNKSELKRILKQIGINEK
jgi:hypothetical protein